MTIKKIAEVKTAIGTVVNTGDNKLIENKSSSSNTESPVTFNLDEYLGKKTKEIDDKLNNYNRDIEKVNSYIMGVLIFFGVTTCLTFFAIIIDVVNNKDLVSVFQNSSEKYINEREKINESFTKLEKDFNNLKNQIEIIKIKNYLK